MKKVTFLSLWVLLLGFVFASCEKAVLDDESNSESQSSNVVIRVSDIETGWSAGWSGVETRALVNVSEVCSRLCFAVYQNGTRVKYKNQAAGDSDFGVFSLELESGSYQLLVLAHSGNANPATTNPNKLQFTNPESSNGTGYTDTFYYYGDLVVSGDKTTADISMKRATSKFCLVTTDTKPANIKKFQFYYEGGSGALDATTGFGCVNSKQSVFVNLDDSQTDQTLQFEMYTFLHAESGSVTFTVKAFDAKEDIIYTKEFKDVPMQRNCITRYTGKFFVTDTPDVPDTPDDPDPEEPSSMVVMVDPEWSTVLDYTF
ncbi:MAG: FimB/Mfa2 family fimbrial subunit [Prevotella sp.]|nr:FimB/Mfa2 family fimbrial subunit [Prevotella sp.]